MLGEVPCYDADDARVAERIQARLPVVMRGSRWVTRPQACTNRAVAPRGRSAFGRRHVLWSQRTSGCAPSLVTDQHGMRRSYALHWACRLARPAVERWRVPYLKQHITSTAPFTVFASRSNFLYCDPAKNGGR